jgi:putative hydrolase of the HAD superfamily
MKTKLILFDWGNIVESHTTGYSCSDAFDDLFHECGYTGTEKVFHLLSKYLITRIQTVDEFEKTYELMAKEFGFNKSFNEFVELYKKIFAKIDYYQDVADYEVSLKDRCYIGILSNLTIFDKRRLTKQIDLSKYDYVFLSYEMGVRKPNIEMYKKVEKILPVKGKDVLFIDDRSDNIETANKIGWNTLQATGLELDKIKERCEQFLNDK